MKPKRFLIGLGLALALPISAISLSIISSAKKEVPIRAQAANAASLVTIDGVSFAANPYYKNGDTSSFSGDPDDYNAYYDDSTGTLTLDGYQGGRIKCNGADSLTIVLVNDNVLTATETGDLALYCIETSAGLTIQGDGSLKIVGNKDTVSYSASGIYVHGQLNLQGNADIKIDMTGVTKVGTKGIEAATGMYIGYGAALQVDVYCHENQDSVYGIYAAAGSLTWATSGDTIVNVGSDRGISSYAIYNAAIDETVNQNGHIGVGGGGDIILNKLGDGYADGIVVGPENDHNLAGDIVFASGADISINGFGRGIWSVSNPRATAAADITISNNANIEIISDYEDAYGIVSEQNGIDIGHANVYIETSSSPLHTAGHNAGYGYSNNSTYGIDIHDDANVRIKSDGSINTNSNATCDIALTGSGHFDFSNSEDEFPALNGTFKVKFHPGSRFVDESHYQMRTDTVAPDGGMSFYHYATYESDHMEFEAYTLPTATTVEINGHEFTTTNCYYVNDAADTTSTAAGYNAHYDAATATLYLKGYEGGQIYFYGDGDGLFKIVLEDDSTINDVTGIDVCGSANLEITSFNFSYLHINASNASGDATCIKVADGDLTFAGSANLRFTSIASSTETGSARGLHVGYQTSNGSVYFKNNIDVNITVQGNHENNLGTQSAVMAATNIVFDTKNSGVYTEQTFSTYQVQGPSFTLFCLGHIRFNSYYAVQLKWSEKDGEYSFGPTYPFDELANVDNGAVNVSESNRTATIAYGDSYHITVENGVTANAGSGNYLLNATGYIQANTIPDVPFVRWEHTGPSEYIGGYTAESSYAGITVKGNDTFTAIYDFIDRAPAFDTRGAADSGCVNFKLKGEPDDTVVVDASTLDYVCSITSGEVKSDSSLPDGTYKIRATYGDSILYTNSFTVDHTQPATGYTVTFHSSASGTGADHVYENVHGDFELPDGTSWFTPPTGRKFDFWAEGRPGGTGRVVGYVANIVDDMDYYAVYRNLNNYTVTFANDGNATGSMAAATNVVEDSNYELPEPAYTPNNFFVFDHWDIGGVEHQPGDSILMTGNISATAIYTEIPTHTLSFNHGSGTGSMSPVVLHEGEHYALPACGFTAPEYFEFAAWSVGGTRREAGYDFVMGNADIEIIAMFDRVQVTVTFGQGEGTGSMDPVQVGKGLNYTLPQCGFTAPEGYHFSGWKMAGNTYQPGDEVPINGSITFTAQYAINVYTVTFNANGGTGSLAPVNKEHGETLDIPENPFTAPEHKHFVGWSLSESGAIIDTATIDITSDVTLYAIWAYDTHTITFSAGEGTGTLDPIEKAYNDSYTLPACPETWVAPEGQEFDGWMVNGVKHAAGETITITGDTTITAVWKVPTPVTPDEPTPPTNPEQPAKKGLSGGAIAAIVIASVLVVGVGGFALVWFVVLKKTWADFVAIFKKK